MSEKLSLTELQLIIRDSLYLALPDMYWVIAEISEIKENYAGHCYLELIEKNNDERNVRAKVKALIWNNRYRFLRSFFENITGESLKAGIKILIKVKIEYHELYGLSLIITDIDPAFTIGEMAIKRQEIIKQLELEGVFSMNRDLDMPALPQRIAIISSRNAAGYQDFINHLTDNNFGYLFYYTLFDSVMQGLETEESVITALDKIMYNIHHFDVVVIIRGGGSQSDLSWFDNYNIAYHITQFPLPVISGIGHDKDLTVTDMVANKSMMTPTAVADFLINCMSGTEDHLTGLSTEIKDLVRIIIDQNRNRIETSAIKLFPAAKLKLSVEKDKLSGKIIETINIGKDFTFRAGLTPANLIIKLYSGIKTFFTVKDNELAGNRQNIRSVTGNAILTNNQKIDALEYSLNILDPEKVLLRGYTITSKNGRILKNIQQVGKDDIINTRFSDGTLESRVKEIKKKNKND
jgi:exodeoxyribonuclease VII large subunit